MPILRCALVFASLCTAGVASAETAPRADMWVSYQGLIYSNEREVTERGFIEDHGDGFIPQFRVRLRGASQEIPGGRQGRTDALPPLDVEPNAESASSDNAALLFKVATLDMPPGTGSSSNYFRTNREWRWRYDRINSGGAREVATELNLLEEAISPAADICRLVNVRTAREPSSDRCRIAVIIDVADGWPLTAEVTRTLTTANGSAALQTVTFERLEPR